MHHKTFCYQTWYCDASEWARVSCETKIVCCLQGQGHSEGSYYQNITLTSTSSELLILWLPKLVWWQVIIGESVLCKNWIIAVKVKVTANVKLSMFIQMIFFFKPPNILLPNSVLWGITMSWSVIQKGSFAIFMVKVTARARMIKMWQFLPYLMNCWSFCYKTWFDSTLS